MADKNDPAKARDAALKEQRAASDADTQAQLDRISSSQPTPTQEENDRAKLGLQSLEELDNKEPDGSPEVKSAAPAAAGTYQTRDAKPTK
jgi:hypothetical protein